MGHVGPNRGGGLGAGGHALAFRAGAEAQVHEDDIDAAGLRGGNRAFGGGYLGHHFDVLGGLQYGAQAEADNLVVVSQQYPDQRRSPR